MDRGAMNRSNIIEKLNTEKHQLHNQLKELVNRQPSNLLLFKLFVLNLDGNSNENNSGSYGIKRRI